MLRKVESVAGVAAGIIGLIGLLVFAFAPIVRHGRSAGVSPAGSPTTMELNSTAMISEQPLTVIRILVVGVLILLGLAAGAWYHGRRSSPTGGLLLIVSTVLLWLGAILGLFSVGLFLLPAALLALVSLWPARAR